MYWNLIHNNVSNNVLLPVPTSDSIEIADKQNKLHTNINSINNIELHSNERLSMNKFANNKALYFDKLNRYKKEKKFRKISQKLADELKPKFVEFAGIN